MVTTRLIYVGCTTDIRRRWESHRRGKSHGAVSALVRDFCASGGVPRLLILQVIETERYWHADEVEERWIAHANTASNPLCNRVGTAPNTVDLSRLPECERRQPEMDALISARAEAACRRTARKKVWVVA